MSQPVHRGRQRDNGLTPEFALLGGSVSTVV
jgi:hypothetical protein